MKVFQSDKINMMFFYSLYIYSYTSMIPNKQTNSDGDIIFQNKDIKETLK